MRTIENDKKKLQLVDLAGIGNLLEYLAAKDAISCEERDRIIQRIAKDDGFDEFLLPILTGLGHDEKEALKRSYK